MWIYDNTGGMCGCQDLDGLRRVGGVDAGARLAVGGERSRRTS